MKIEKIKISDIKPAEYNPRQITSDELQKLTNSINEFGLVDPIIINLKNNKIIGGHQRYEVLINQYLLNNEFNAELNIIKLGDIGWIFTETDLKVKDEDHEKALNLALNKISGEWDLPKLEVLLEELDLKGFDITLTGFDGIDDLNMDLDEDLIDVEEDDYEEPDDLEVTVKYGDLYQLGQHRLLCGDATKKEDILKLLNNNKIDMVYTDAPYGISIVNEKTNKVGAGNLAKNKQYLKIKGDDTTDTAKKFYNHCISLNIDNFILWGGNYFTDFLPFSPSWLIWDKRVDMNSNNFADGEMAWCSFKTPVRIYHQLWNGMIREGEHEDRVHPTQKPIKMQCEILMDFTSENYNILDSFGGSGSTLIACEQLNRNCYMMEYEPYYCQIIIDRWETLTGEKATKIRG